MEETIRELRKIITCEQNAFDANLRALELKARSALDWREQSRKHPFMTTALVAVASYSLWRLLEPSGRWDSPRIDVMARSRKKPSNYAIPPHVRRRDGKF